MAITLDDVVLEQMQTNELLDRNNVVLTALRDDTHSFKISELFLLDKLNGQMASFIDVFKKDAQDRIRRENENAREGGGDAGGDDNGGGDGEGGDTGGGAFKQSFGQTAGAGLGSAVGLAASLTALGAGIAGFIGALTVAGGVANIFGIDFSGMKKMLVGVGDAFASASTVGLIKFMVFMGAAKKFLGTGDWKKDAKALSGLGLGLSGFILALGAAGSISTLFGLDYGGLRDMMVGVSEAFAAVDPIGFAIMAGVVKLLDASGMSLKTMASIGAGLAALIAPLAVVGAASGAIGGGKGLKDLLGGLGDGMAALGIGNLLILTALGATLMILGGGTPLTGVLAFGAIGLGLAALITPLAAVGAASGAMGGGAGLRDLLTGLGDGLASFSEVNFLNMALAGPALTSLSIGLAALTAGTLIASLGDFITSFFSKDDEESAFEKIATDLEHFNKVDFKNIAALGPAALALDQMADAMEKMSKVDDGVFSRVGGFLKNIVMAPTRAIAAATTSNFTPAPPETYEATGQQEVAEVAEQQRQEKVETPPRSRRRRSEYRLVKGVRIEDDKIEEFAQRMSENNLSYNEVPLRSDGSIDEERDAIRQQIMKEMQDYGAEAVGDDIRKTASINSYIQRQVVNRSKEIKTESQVVTPIQKVVLHTGVTEIASQPRADVAPLPVNTSITETVNREAVNSAAESAAPPMMIVDNSVQAPVTNNMANQASDAPMPSPTTSNRTRASAYSD